MTKSVVGASGAGAGDGKIMAGTKLECGHSTLAREPVSSGPSGKLYRCPQGCGLVHPERKR